MELRDYIEEIEPKLSKSKGRSILRCVIEFSKLLSSVMPESGKNGINVSERFLNNQASENDLETARVAIWEDYADNYKDTPKGAALRTIICALFFPIGDKEYFDTLTYAIDFSREALPNLKDSDFKGIIENEFKA